MRRPAFTIVVVALATGLATGCASPPSHFYTLSRTATAAGGMAAATANLTVVVGPVSIPAIVDQPQIVVSTGANQVTLDEFHRWASPLRSDIARVVAVDLVAILGTPRVSLFQQSLNAAADFRVAIEVQGFESAPGEAATLDAVWQVRRTRDGRAQTGRTTVREPTDGTGFDALAAAHSRALARLSTDIAASISALAPARP
jgi:uncharacterized lipoprotein YmbA